MTMDGFRPVAELVLLSSGMGGAILLAIVADRLKSRRKRSRRLMAMEARMNMAWETAKVRILWSAPGFLAARGTKYTNSGIGQISGSTTREISRYIGG